MNRRPITVTILGCVLIATGVASLAFHVTDLKASRNLLSELLLLSLVRVLAIVSGVFMLRGSNWARWLALAWIAFHVAISFSCYSDIFSCDPKRPHIFTVAGRMDRKHAIPKRLGP
jgi:uncharacterized membrane protein